MPEFDTDVQLVCNKDNIKNPLFQYLTKNPSISGKTTFVFRLEHTCCCPDSCKNGLPSGGGGGDDGGGGGKMSYGTLIAILFGVAIVTYLVMGKFT